ncbi:hypothetical protein ZEAMMB73_Zm00001d044731 [Zea mays]|uniref:Uncharacterized protein n=1 Tax=Zea mays TaxID=4577 RepID=K7V538_MAIZE|nr:hypothetical protein ZEAMMB73_Zm00001d044731 [Zea mays]
MAPASSPVAGSSTRSVASATSSGYDALSPSDPASRRRGHNQAWPGRDNQVQPSQRPRRSEGVRGWGDASAHSRLPPRGGSGAETGGEGGRPRGVGIWEGSEHIAASSEDEDEQCVMTVSDSPILLGDMHMDGDILLKSELIDPSSRSLHQTFSFGQERKP